MKNIFIINGSPKPKYSITLQTSLFLQKKFTDCNFEFSHVAKLNKELDTNPNEVFEKICVSDIVIFSYPVYTFIAPYQLHLFIEKLKKHNFDFSGKVATQITTSKHFYDVTAHRYIKDNALDLGFNFINGLSADMEDLLKTSGQKEAENFFKRVLWCTENQLFDDYPNKNQNSISTEKPTSIVKFTDEFKIDLPKDDSKEIVIITDYDKSNPQDKNLKLMIDKFIDLLPYKTKIVNIREYKFKGGCLGCFRCASDGKCIYTDGFDEFLRNEIQTASSMIYAFRIKEHSMGSVFKLYDDRQFCNGHRTVTIGMPVGYLVSGNLSQEENLRTIIQARSDVGGNFLAGIATDEISPSSKENKTEFEIYSLVKNLIFAFENKFTQSANFYGIGGMKIFRDLIYQMQGMMKADHKFYKKQGLYNDFPQKHKGKIFAMYLVGLLNSPKLASKIGNKMNEGMIAPYKILLDNLDKNANRI